MKKVLNFQRVHWDGFIYWNRCCAILKKGNKKNHVFIILGDGEYNEGSVWEGAMAANHFY